MYGALADAKPSGGFPHGGSVLNNIGGQLASPLLDVSLQAQHSLSRYAPCICAGSGEHADCDKDCMGSTRYGTTRQDRTAAPQLRGGRPVEAGSKKPAFNACEYRLLHHRLLQSLEQALLLDRLIEEGLRADSFGILDSLLTDQG